jgi:hypothetical protein
VSPVQQHAAGGMGTPEKSGNEGRRRMTTELIAPASRAVHAVTNTLQILYGIRDTLPLIEWEAVSRAIALLSPVPIDVAALFSYIETQESNIATMIDESNQTHRDLSSTHEKCAALLAMLHTANVRAAAAERMISFDAPRIVAAEAH